jgi:hypothetical protein
LGREYRDRYVTPGTVVYCAFEGGHGYTKRIEALRRHYHLGEQCGVPLKVMPGNVNLIADHKLLIGDLMHQLGDATPVAVVLDTLNRSLLGSENKDVDMGNYLRAAEVIRDTFECVVIIVHHCGYDDTRPRGHSSLPAAVDAQLSVARDDRVITVKVEMMRDGPEETEVVSEVEVVDVGQDCSGRALTSLVVLPSDAAAVPAGNKRWTRGIATFMAALKHALKHHGTQFQPEAGELPVEAVDQEWVRKQFYATYADDDDDEPGKLEERIRKAFNRSKKTAQEVGAIGLQRLGIGQVMLWEKQGNL